MTRLLGLPALLIVLAVGGYLYTKDAKSNGPTSGTVTRRRGASLLETGRRLDRERAGGQAGRRELQPMARGHRVDPRARWRAAPRLVHGEDAEGTALHVPPLHAARNEAPRHERAALVDDHPEARRVAERSPA